MRKKTRDLKSNVDVSRPFSEEISREAESIASGYRVVIEPNDEVGFLGRSIELPLVLQRGETPDECVRNTYEALVGAVAAMIEVGRPPPSAKGRTVQVNVRLTAEEKFALEEAASREGFRGLSDFVRSAAIEKARQT